MIELQAATVLLQWSTGCLLFLWVTTRRREVGLGYGWLSRGIYGALALGAAVVGFVWQPVVVRDLASVGVAVACAGATWVSVRRRRAGVAGQREVTERRTARVAAMTGIDREEQRFDSAAPEFPPSLDLIAPAIGFIGLISGAVAAGGPVPLSLARVLVGAAFLGAVTDAMSLGHWYLVQPGLARGALIELVDWSRRLWLPELVVLLWPTGMVSVLNGSIDDGYSGLLGWFWVACVVTTIVLLFVTRAALREREYSAVMAATGLLYLAILTAFGMDLVARVLLSP